jgi:hypothetical protein
MQMNSSHRTRLNNLERKSSLVPMVVIGSDAQECERRVSAMQASGILDCDAQVIVIATGVRRAEDSAGEQRVGHDQQH